MREIKFRVFDTQTKQFIPNDDEEWPVEIYRDGIVQALIDNEWVSPPRLVLMQFTGLKDKNGKEINEGDILLIPDDYTEVITDDGQGPTEPCNHLSVVVFKEGAFGVEIIDPANIYRRGFHSMDFIHRDIGDSSEELFEVIGNIYENPELLK
jgi:uncharacterized phage protein (TIGR01671 family)